MALKTLWLLLVQRCYSSSVRNVPAIKDFGVLEKTENAMLALSNITRLAGLDGVKSISLAGSEHRLPYKTF